MSLKVITNTEGSKHKCNVSSVVCFADGVASGSDDGNIKIWKPDLEFVAEMEAPGGILSMAACDHMLYACATDGNIHAFDLKAAKHVGQLTTTLHQPQKVFVEQTTKVLWAGDSQGNVIIQIYPLDL